MRKNFSYLLIGLTAVLVLQSCNLPSSSVSPSSAAATGVAATLSSLRTKVAATETALAVPTTALPTPSATPVPSVTPTPRNPIVTQLALCWTGPGSAYTVVSSVKPGTSLQPVGVGSIAGWLIVQNPIYHDICWIEAKNLQIDPGFDITKLKVYNPPPTPEPKETPVPTDTP